MRNEEIELIIANLEAVLGFLYTLRSYKKVKKPGWKVVSPITQAEADYFKKYLEENKDAIDFKEMFKKKGACLS